MRFRAVVFDLGGVVLGSPLRVLREYESELGLSPGFLGQLIDRPAAAGAWQRLERGELDLATFIAEFDREAARAGAPISSSRLMERIALASLPHAPMVNAVRRLRAHGLRTAALTNNWVSDDHDLKMNALRPEFDVFVESARVGLRKPDPRIYALVLEQLAVGAHESVFLDDIGANLKPARALGMTTIKVADPELALTELERTLGLDLR